MCKKDFNDTNQLRFNNDEFLRTINVYNENFLSDHIIKSREGFISSNSIRKYSPRRVRNSKRMRASSFDLNVILKKKDLGTFSLTDKYKAGGHINVLKLPKVDPPYLPSLNGSKHSYIFKDVNTSYENLKLQLNPCKAYHDSNYKMDASRNQNDS